MLSRQGCRRFDWVIPNQAAAGCPAAWPHNGRGVNVPSADGRAIFSKIDLKNLYRRRGANLETSY